MFVLIFVHQYFTDVNKQPPKLFSVSPQNFELLLLYYLTLAFDIIEDLPQFFEFLWVFIRINIDFVVHLPAPSILIH